MVPNKLKVLGKKERGMEGIQSLKKKERERVYIYEEKQNETIVFISILSISVVILSLKFRAVILYLFSHNKQNAYPYSVKSC
jgi:hypothetical protein